MFNIKFHFIGLFFLLGNNLIAQKYIIYELGRPNSLEYNNAKRIISEKYKINFIYATDEIKDSLDVSMLESQNRLSNKKLATRYDNDLWHQDFYNKVAEELDKHEQMRVFIKTDSSYIKLKATDIRIIFEKKKLSINSYLGYVVGWKIENDKSIIRILATYKTSTKKYKLLNLENKQLHFSYKVNGIE